MPSLAILTHSAVESSVDLRSAWTSSPRSRASSADAPQAQWQTASIDWPAISTMVKTSGINYFPLAVRQLNSESPATAVAASRQEIQREQGRHYIWCLHGLQAATGSVPDRRSDLLEIFRKLGSAPDCRDLDGEKARGCQTQVLLQTRPANARYALDRRAGNSRRAGASIASTNQPGSSRSSPLTGASIRNRAIR